MATDAISDADKANCNDPWKELLTRRIKETVRKTFLEEITACLQKMQPGLDKKHREFRPAVVLLAAAYFTGPDVDRLVHFTGYSRKFVDGISARMCACGRWANDKVHTEHWFEADNCAAFWLDCMVAEGAVEFWQAADGTGLVRLIE